MYTSKINVHQQNQCTPAIGSCFALLLKWQLNAHFKKISLSMGGAHSEWKHTHSYLTLHHFINSFLASRPKLVFKVVNTTSSLGFCQATHLTNLISVRPFNPLIPWRRWEIQPLVSRKVQTVYSAS